MKASDFYAECGALDAARKTAKEHKAAAYKTICEQALEWFSSTGDKTPDDDVKVREEKEVEYQPAAALAWAASTGRTDLLKLDTSAFEKAARAGEVPDHIAGIVRRHKGYVSSRLGHRLLAKTTPDEGGQADSR